jgi:hypothetical protein
MWRGIAVSSLLHLYLSANYQAVRGYRSVRHQTNLRHDPGDFAVGQPAAELLPTEKRMTLFPLKE